MEKRGQVAIFVVIGIVLLVIILIVLAVKEFIIKSDIETQLAKHKNVPLEVLPIVESVDSCLKSISEEAINLIGLQGGYINLPQETIPTSPYSPLSRNLEILPNLETALWFREKPNGEQVLEMPSIESMQSEIVNYIDKNSDRCLNNLTYFVDQQYSISQTASSISLVEIYNENILIRLTVTLEITYKRANFPVDPFFAEIESNLGKLYNTANEIATQEIETYFLENMTIDMLVAYDSIVPYSGTKFECKQDAWSKTEVIKSFKEILIENTAAITIKNTKITPLDDYFSIDALESSQKDISVNFKYSSNWPTLVEISPSEGDILKSDTTYQNSIASQILSSFVCINNHHFIYDIKYPVLITLQDENNQIFQFAFEVILDNNQPRKNQIISEEIPQESEEICKYAGVPLTILTYSLNKYSELETLTGVDLSFKCSTSACKLGSSELDNFGDSSTTIQVPQCFNAIIEGNKAGYFRGKSIVSTNEENPQVTITLEPILEKTINLFIIEKDTGEKRDPFSSEQITFYFTHQTEPYTYVYNYPDPTIKLIPGDYEISAFITGNSTWPIKFEKQIIENCVALREPGILGFFATEEKCFKQEIPEMELDFALKGGERFNYTFERYDLGNSQSINLYVLAQQLPSTIDQLTQISLNLDTNHEHPNFRYPEYE